MLRDDEFNGNSALGNAPTSGGVEDRDELHRRCADEREELTPKETADCAGAELSELYENEEDGGS